MILVLRRSRSQKQSRSRVKVEDNQPQSVTPALSIREKRILILLYAALQEAIPLAARDMTNRPSPVFDELVEHYRLNTFFDGETTTHISNAQGPHGVRGLKTITKWKRTRKLGEGGAGSVWLETMEGRQTKTRAVKVIAKGLRSINTGY